MSFRPLIRYSLIVLVLLAALSGCVGRPGAAQVAASLPQTTPSTSRTMIVLADGTTVDESAEAPVKQGTATGKAAATALPQVTTLPAVTETPTLTKKTPIGSSRPPSGWALYSNPDYVRGLIVHDRLLWTATLGGVVAWNLDTEMPTLYTTRDGLAEIQSNAIVYCPMPQERIVVAHSSGVLSVYDLSLKRWSRILITFDDGETFTGVTSLFCDAANQRLMVGSTQGLGILDNKTGHWRRIGPAEGLKADTIQSIDVVGQAIWVAAKNKGAFLIMGSTVFPFNAASGFPSGDVNALSVAPDQSIWFGYSTGLVHYKDKKWNSYGGSSISGLPFHSVDRVEVGPDKLIWIVSANEGVCPFDSITFNCATVYPVGLDAPVTDLAVGTDGSAYAGTDGGGVLVLESERVRRLTFKREQLMSNDVMDIAASADGRLWVATDQGINTLDPGRTIDAWTQIKPKRGQLAFPRVNGLLSTANGMWIFYDQQPMASFYDGEKWLHLDQQKGISAPVISAAVDQRGYIWFASAEDIQVWDGTLMRQYKPTLDLPGNQYRTLYSDGSTMWIGTEQGLLRYEHSTWQMVIPGLAVNTIAHDPRGGLILGTQQGLVRYDGSQSYFWIINLGSEIVISPQVTSIAVDGSQRLWVGTANSGMFSYDGTVWKRYNTASGLPADKVRKIFTDRFGSIWVAAGTGAGGGALIRFVP